MPNPMKHARRAAILLGLAGLAGCALPQVDPLDLPPQVAAEIPSDIDLSEVNRDLDGCYFYTYAADLFVVRDRSGEPICLP